MPSSSVIVLQADRQATKASQLQLQYVEDSTPGIHREKKGSKFQYRSSSGAIIRARKTLSRIDALVIPPAWTDVWICTKPNGHLQATGRDARRRKQYLYHPHWREIRDVAKYENLIEFAKALPRMRRRIAADLRRKGLPREKVLAAIVRLMETSLIRVGNDEYARTNGSFGLTTLRDRHVSLKGSRICFQFRGKSGVQHQIDLDDQQLATIVRKCQELPGQELFQYRDEAGRVRDIGSSDVNGYLREISGGEFTAKDFRTWAGTSLATKSLLDCEDFVSVTEAKRNVNRAIDHVAQQLGNTRAICRQSYIHPGVFDCYLNRTLAMICEVGVKRQQSRGSVKISQTEIRVLALLEQQVVRKVARSRSQTSRSIPTSKRSFSPPGRSLVGHSNRVRRK